jgi:predicted GTPase
MGETGSGKSTFVNGMVNHLLGAEWDDPYRVYVIDDSYADKKKKNSQTSTVTSYAVIYKDNNEEERAIEIIDTPGYGDTKGINIDNMITEKIHDYLLNNQALDTIDAVCFTIASGTPRLTVTQNYILNSVLSIFGEDVRANIRLLVTFADNQPPPAIIACKQADFPTNESGEISYCKFNSSSLYIRKSEDKKKNYFDIFFGR